MTITDYTSLITSEHSDRPNFVATFTGLIAPYVQLQSVLASMPAAFDIDLAVGVQLDAVGRYVGISRTINAALTGVYFQWDTNNVGWAHGIWMGAYDPSTGVVNLPDPSYRTLLKAKIARNRWDGSIPGAYKIWESLFPGSYLFIQDNQNMTMTVGVSGMALNNLDQALLFGGYLSLRPAGVKITSYSTVVNDGTIFGWDQANSNVWGQWDTGQWPLEYQPT